MRVLQMVLGPALSSVMLAWTPLQGAFPPFPNQPGTRWVYELKGRYTLRSKLTTFQAASASWYGTWTMEVLERKEYRGHRLLLVKGSVFQITSPFEWEASKPSPGLGVLVLDDRGRVYQPNLEDVEKAWKGKPARIIAALNDESIYFGWPAKPQDTWGEPAPNRKDGMYQWRAEGWVPRHPKIKGWKGSTRGLNIALRTLPDHFALCFVPRLGITRFEYAHHGTIGRFEARLTRVEGPDFTPRDVSADVSAGDEP